MSNYPPGVSGFEDQIAGPRSEQSDYDVKECDDCGFEGEVLVTRLFWRDSVEDTWECPDCKSEHSEDVAIDAYGEDYDD